MNMKKTLPVLALAMITMFAVTAVRAQSAETTAPKVFPKPGQVSPEDRAAREALWLDYQKKAGPIRDQLWAKKMEYEFLLSRPEAKLADVKPVIEEMVKLKGQLRTERESFAAEARAKGFGPMGFGPMGFHPMGFDRDGRGHGFDRGDCLKMMGRGKHKDGRGQGRPQPDNDPAAQLDMDM